MKTELTDVSPTLKELKIEIEPQRVLEAFDRISKQYSTTSPVVLRTF